MSHLLDIGILLRVADRQDVQHAIVMTAVRKLIYQGEVLQITTQNAAEFYNVATRPIANNGLGLATSESLELLEQEIEPICSALDEPPAVYHELKRLIAAHNVTGKQVHDARLVAMMLVWQIEKHSHAQRPRLPPLRAGRHRHRHPASLTRSP